MVVSSFGAMFFGDPVRAFANLAGALRPGRPGRPPGLARAGTTTSGCRHCAAPWRQGVPCRCPPTGCARVRSGSPTRTGCAACSLASGLVDVELEQVDEPIEFGSDAEEAYEFVAGMGFTRGLTADLDDVARDAALESLHAALAAAQTDRGVRVRLVGLADHGAAHG